MPSPDVRFALRNRHRQRKHRRRLSANTGSRGRLNLRRRPPLATPRKPDQMFQIGEAEENP
jgi:hypothetical protein